MTSTLSLWQGPDHWAPSARPVHQGATESMMQKPDRGAGRANAAPREARAAGYQAGQLLSAVQAG